MNAQQAQSLTATARQSLYALTLTEIEHAALRGRDTAHIAVPPWATTQALATIHALQELGYAVTLTQGERPHLVVRWG